MLWSSETPKTIHGWLLLRLRHSRNTSDEQASPDTAASQIYQSATDKGADKGK
ncbi:hypothetical protein [Chroococcidiopsis cubana]|nr:hypothetical protein [Chroococcidiopsis cubana]